MEKNKKVENTNKIVLTEDKNTNLEMVAKWTREFWEADPESKARLGK